MHETEDGEKNPNGLTDFLDFHGLLPTLEHIGRKGKNPRQGGLPDSFAQSPVCGRDDGVPHELDGITFSSWRQQSVKGYGNAIVPQVIHEIFKAIESTYKQ